MLEQGINVRLLLSWKDFVKQQSASNIQYFNYPYEDRIRSLIS